MSVLHPTSAAPSRHQGRKYLTNEERAAAEAPDQDGVVTQKVRRAAGQLAFAALVQDLCHWPKAQLHTHALTTVAYAYGHLAALRWAGLGWARLG